MWKAILAAVAAYSVVPVPQVSWEERHMRYAICWFPVVGLLCGGALLVWQWFCRWMAVGPVMFAAVAACLPLLLTGGIHMDGFMDTVDALASHQSRERKLEIMKDSACGAFAVVYCGVYLLLQFALFHEVREPVCGGIYVLSRALSAFCAVTMPNARTGGMLQGFTEHAKTRFAAAAMMIAAAVTAAGMIWVDPRRGGMAVVCGAAVVLWYRAMANRQFGGVTGDTSGFFLQVCELAALGGVWLGGLL